MLFCISKSIQVMGFSLLEGYTQKWAPQDSWIESMHRGGDRLRTFFIFGKSSFKELKGIGLNYKAEVVNLMKNFGGDEKSM